MLTAQRKILLKRLPLYLVAPDGWGSEAWHIDHLRVLLSAGVGIVQFRDKAVETRRQERALRMRELCREHDALFIVNDDPNLARAIDADGVHVGASDVDVATARSIVGNEKIVGATAHTIARGVACVEHGADYLGVGAIFDATKSKPDAVTIGIKGLRDFCTADALRETIVVAIGGIRLCDIQTCLDAGADGVAMIRALWGVNTPDELKAWIPR